MIDVLIDRISYPLRLPHIIIVLGKVSSVFSLIKLNKANILTFYSKSEMLYHDFSAQLDHVGVYDR